MTVIPWHWHLIVASSLFSLSNAQWKNTSKESEDHDKYLQWKKHAEQFPQGTYRLSQISSCGSNIIIHPLRNIMDVSVLGGWCCKAPPGALAYHWGSTEDARWEAVAGAPEGAEALGQRGPTQRRRHYHPQLLSWWLGSEITRWQVNIHFCVKDVSLVWGRLFLLSRRQYNPLQFSCLEKPKNREAW